MLFRVPRLIALGVGLGALGLTPANAAPGDPFPPLETVLQEMVRRAETDAQHDREFESRYRFTHSRTREERNLRGVIKHRESESAVLEPGSGRPPSTDWRGDAVARVGGESRGGGAGAADEYRTYTQDDVRLTESLLRRFEFRILTREDVAGRSALKLDFRPASSRLPGRGLIDRFINHTAGTVWVDEGDYTISRAVFWLTEKLNVGGGILGSVSAFHCRFERDRTPEGFWYTANVRWRVDCREFMVNKVIESREVREDVEAVR